MSGRTGTIVLAILLIAVYLYEVAMNAAGDEPALLALGALRTRGWSAADGWRVFTFSFLHLNAAHLALNLAGLLWLGGIVERRLGKASMGLLFAAAGVSSGVLGMLLGPFLPTTGIVVGASGAVFGLLAAALTLVFRRDADQKDKQNQPLRRGLLACFVAGTVISLLPGISLAGHLGGFIAGALVIRVLIHRRLQTSDSVA
jgi:membrane associated rhomboid family serine protease